MENLQKKVENRIRMNLPKPVLSDEWFTVDLQECETIEYKGEYVKECSNAIMRALDLYAQVYVPYSEEAIYINKAVILNTGNYLKIHPDTRIVLIGDSLMLHNRNIIDGHLKYVSPNENSDSDIYVSGGIWEAPDTQKNWFGGAKRDFYGCDSLFMFSNVYNVCIENITFKNSNRMAIQIGNCRNFIVNQICLDNVNRDGVHVEGPAKFGLIKNICGKSGDDCVALNSWDWAAFSLTFGTISNIIIEDIYCQKGHLWSEIRMLSGVKFYESGEITDCYIYNIICKNIHDIHTFKMYFQPEPSVMPKHNEVICYDTNSSERSRLGSMYNLFFDSIDMNYFPAQKYHYPKKGAFEIYSNVNGLFLKDIQFDYQLRSAELDNYSVIAVGKPDEDTIGASCYAENIFVNNISDESGNVLEEEKIICIRDTFSKVSTVNIK